MNVNELRDKLDKLAVNGTTRVVVYLEDENGKHCTIWDIDDVSVERGTSERLNGKLTFGLSRDGKDTRVFLSVIPA